METSAWDWTVPILITAIYAVLAFYFYPWLVLQARRRLRHAEDMWRDLLFYAIRWPLVILLCVAGAALLTHSWPPTPRVLSWRVAIDHLELIAVIIAAALFFQHWVVAAYRTSSEVSWLRVTFLRKLLLIALYIVTLLMVMSELGIDIGAPLVSLGIGSLAVGLAVKDILANFFAGVQLAMERPLESGQTIALENGMSGRVIWINWLNTHLRAPDGSLLIVPNARMIGFVLGKVSLAEPQPVTTVVLGIDRGADLERAQQVALETARQVLLRIGGAVAPPAAQYTNLSATSAELSVRLGSANPAALDELRSAYLKAVNAALAQAGIKLV